jgi:hypothetical protein
MNWLRTTLDPSRYHGYGQQPPFFEGWYYKLVDAEQQHRLAIIPGIFHSSDPAKAHAFIQLLDGATGNANYFRYPRTLFWAARDRFDVRIGPNRFSDRFLTLNIDDVRHTIRGTVHFTQPTPWPVTLGAPGIMGWYAWVPFMETYHGVVSLDHGLRGQLTVDKDVVTFDGGRGYAEKDWGRSFPAGYVWMQTNHFTHPGTSLTASVAIIPWLRNAFAGFIIGLWHEGHLYRFATYTGARTEKLTISDERVTWIVRDKYRRLHIKAERKQGGLLYAPTREAMHDRVGETMLASISVALNEWQSREQQIFRDTGRHAALEVHGDVIRLLQMVGS